MVGDPRFTAMLHENFRIHRLSLHRKHGDPFPLPLLRDEVVGRLPIDGPLRQMDVAAKTLNDLAAVPFHETKPCPDRNPTTVQEWIMGDLWRRIREYGPSPDDLSEETALRELVATRDLYSQEAGTRVADFDIDRIKVLKRSLEPTCTQQLGPEEVRHFIKHYDEFIERPPCELEAPDFESGLPEPFWASKLRRSKKQRILLYQRLHACNLLALRRRRKARAGIFSVMKKDQTQRLIVDARQANACHYRPPTTRLSTPSGLLSLDYSLETLEASGFGGPLSDHPGGHAEAGDVGDCFYNFTIPEMCSWFGFDDSFDTQELKALGLFQPVIYDDDVKGETPVEEGERLFVCFGGMPMGWAWSLYFANEVIVHQCSLPRGGNLDDVIRDKRPAPELQPGRPAVGVYADNVNVFGVTMGEAGARMDGIASTFERLGIPFVVDHVESSQKLEGLGLHFDMEGRVVAHSKSRRAWRLWWASRCLLRRSKVHGKLLQIWLGHMVHHFQVMRPCMSALSACYRFVVDHGHHRARLWPSVRREIKHCLGPIFLVEFSLSAPTCREVHVGDSSDYGYSLMVTEAEHSEVKQELKFRERWRFIESDEPDEVDHKPLDTWTEGEDMADLQSYHYRGAKSCSGLWMATQYGQELEKKLGRSKGAGRFEMRKRPRGTRTLLHGPSIPDVSDKWSKDDRWTLLVAKPWDDPSEHINSKEARVALMGLRRLCRSVKNMGATALSLSDNLVTVLAFEKGRSSASTMGGLCKKAAAYQIACRIQWRLRHIRSEKNVADQPSRWFGPSSVEKRFRKQPTGISYGHVPVSHFEAEIPMVETFSKPPKADEGLGLFVEMLSGCGQLTSQMRLAGVGCGPELELLKGKQYNLLRKSTQRYIKRLIRKRKLRYIHFGTPCTVFSAARHNISNIRRAKHKEAIGVALACFTASCIQLLLRCDGYFSLENPLTSKLWQFPLIEPLFRLKRCIFIRWDMCMYGAPHKKPTALLTNLGALAVLGRQCDHSHQHIQLRGSETVLVDGKTTTQSKTKRAGEYPLELCKAWAQVVQDTLVGRILSAHGVKSNHERFWIEHGLKQLANLETDEQLAKPPGLPVRKSNEEEECFRSVAEARQFIRERGVVFGQYTKEQAKREAKKAAHYRETHGLGGETTAIDGPTPSSKGGGENTASIPTGD